MQDFGAWKPGLRSDPATVTYYLLNLSEPLVT